MTQDTGAYGEDLAAKALCRGGMRLVARNFHSRWGEIDLIMEDGDCLVFVEVKTRSRDGVGSPAEAVTPAKRRKILRTAEFYLLRHPSRLQPRFDVVEVLVGKGAEPEVRHLPNAFSAQDRFF